MKLNVLRDGKFKDRLLLGVFVLGAVLFSLMYAQPVEAVADPSTVTIDLEKKFSGPVPEGYTADQFVFMVEGSSFGPVAVTLTDFNDDSANGSIDLPVGTYTLTENGPDGFDPSEWTVQWSGAGCENQTALSTTIEVDESDLGKDNFGCRADNQWRHGILTVEKEVVGTTTDVSNFSFVVTHKGNEIFDGPFADGDVKVAVGVGAYTVLEHSAPNYTTTYSDGCSGTMEEDVRVTCTITNTYITDPTPVPGCTDPQANNFNSLATTDDGSCTYDPTPVPGCTDPLATNYNSLATVDDGSCTYDPSVVLGCTDPLAINYNPLATTDDGSCDYGEDPEPTYKVFGYVWHDSNENDIWDGRDGEENQAETLTEDDLDGWTVTITNGEVTYSTTTDETGYYEFYVPAGTWTINETVQDEWQQTFPNDAGVHVVEVIDETVDDSETETAFAPVEALLNGLVDMFLPAVAHAQTLTTYGAYNFGNVFTGGGDDDDDDDEGSTSSGSSSGGAANPRCELNYEIDGNVVTLTWETSFASEVTLTQNGVVILNSTDSDDFDSSTVVTISESTEFVLLAERRSRDRACVVTVLPSAPTGQVLGEQVSVVPVGAPNTGAGGAAPINIPSPTPFVAALMPHARNVFKK